MSKAWLSMLEAGLYPATRKIKRTPIVGVKTGDRNKKCTGCGHKNKKCTCGKYQGQRKL
ncbi:MAG: hypothetical protein J7L15_00935 [Clostridiales bacterium]|nr:hypothetical protein [Clostridiales bacterium]